MTQLLCCGLLVTSFTPPRISPSSNSEQRHASGSDHTFSKGTREEADCPVSVYHKNKTHWSVADQWMPLNVNDDSLTSARPWGSNHWRLAVKSCGSRRLDLSHLSRPPRPTRWTEPVVHNWYLNWHVESTLYPTPYLGNMYKEESIAPVYN